MNDDAQQVSVSALLSHVSQLQAQLHQLQAASDQRARSGDLLPLCEDITGCIPGHLQQEPLEASRRKQVLRAYPKTDPDLPNIIKDENGLAAKAISDATSRKWITTLVPTFQRDNLDVARVAATGLQFSINNGDNDTPRIKHLHGVLRDVLVLACDNAQKLAETQLKLTLEAAGAKGAYSLLDLSPNTQDLDFDDGNLLQQSHVEAIQELRRFTNSFKPRGKGGGNGGGNGGIRNGKRGSDRGRDNRNYGGRGSGKNWKGGQYGRQNKDRFNNDDKSKD